MYSIVLILFNEYWNQLVLFIVVRTSVRVRPLDRILVRADVFVRPLGPGLPRIEPDSSGWNRILVSISHPLPPCIRSERQSPG